ncbi:MAG: response regulator transcription factor [Candidatus Fonsibacter sp.]|jgi:two-component system phosphate regulon response regulator OmpR|nr:response regulator transcription factor [Pelagibacterales bacterium]
MVNTKTYHILVIDDDDKIRDLLKQYLKKNNYLVSTSHDAADAEEKISLVKFDLAIVDIMMPGKDGLQLTKEIREKIDLPIILLTAKGETEDRIKGLEYGAEDYLPKPFEPKELLLRIHNVLKRVKKEKNFKDAIKIGKTLIHLKKMEIQNDRKAYKMSMTERSLLENLISSAGKIFTRDEISKITGLTKERSIDVLITRLRQKIEPDTKNPKYLQTVRGAGYVLWID